MPRPQTQQVRLSVDLIEKLREPAATAGRSVPMEAEYRLRRSLEAEPATSFERGLSPWAQAIGRLTAMLANELDVYSRKAAVIPKLKVAIPDLLDELAREAHRQNASVSTNAKLDSDEEKQARDFAGYLWLKLVNAHERSFTDGVANSLTPEQSALLEIRPSLLPAEAKQQPRRRTKE